MRSVLTLLLVAVLTSLVALPSGPGASMTVAAKGCHLPAKHTPPSHQCCQAPQAPAVLQRAVPPQPDVLAVVETQSSEIVLVTPRETSFARLPVPQTGPPAITSLRI